VRVVDTVRSSLSVELGPSEDWCCRPSPAASRCRAGAHGFVAHHAVADIDRVVPMPSRGRLRSDDGGFADARCASESERAARQKRNKESSDANSFMTDRFIPHRTGSRAQAML
jgi:hypothetical protein